MEVYALVEASGTGKSHRALWVAKERNIEYIIDDGLLIRGNEIIAGKSAKRKRPVLALLRLPFLPAMITLLKLHSS